MPCETIALSNLASAFQLVAGAALAVSVFRAPFEAAQQELAARIKVEEQILVNRHGGAVEAHARQLSAIRTNFALACAELANRIKPWELVIWLIALIGGLGLVATSTWPDQNIPRYAATAICVVIFSAPIVALFRVRRLTDVILRDTRKAVASL